MEDFFWDEFAIKKNNIESIIRDYWICIDGSYIINTDGSIDVHGNVKLLKNMNFLTELPLKFNKVTGDFDCSELSLKTLIGSPTEVGGIFNCAYNLLTSLEYLPEKVDGTFIFDNTVKSLYTGGVNCYFNKVLILFQEVNHKVIGLPKVIDGNILKIIFQHQNYYDVWNANKSLNQDNFDEFLEDIMDGLR